MFTCLGQPWFSMAWEWVCDQGLVNLTASMVRLTEAGRKRPSCLISCEAVRVLVWSYGDSLPQRTKPEIQRQEAGSEGVLTVSLSWVAP